jgi:hypothetical protein
MPERPVDAEKLAEEARKWDSGELSPRGWVTHPTGHNPSIGDREGFLKILDLFGEEARLCFVTNPPGDDNKWRSAQRTAYFTTLPVKKQEGEDWDKPISSGTNCPYTVWGHPKHFFYTKSGERGSFMEEKVEKPWKIISLVFEGPFMVPHDWPMMTVRHITDEEEKPTVYDLNREQKVPWIATAPIWSGHYVGVRGDDGFGMGLFAGTPIRIFINEIIQGGGEVWMPIRALVGHDNLTKMKTRGKM